MFSFRLDRLPGDAFADRKEYLTKRISEDNNATTAGDCHSLCNAIGSANEPFNGVRIEEPKPGKPKGLPRNFPWLTLVLGSGCANETIDDSGVASLSPERISGLLADWTRLKDGDKPSDLAFKFARDLIDQRMPDGSRDGRPSIDDKKLKEEDTEIAKLVLATSLLTLLYRGLASEHRQPLDPRGNDRLEMPGKGHESGKKFGEHRLSELKTLYADEFTESLLPKMKQSKAAVRHVLERIGSNLKGVARNKSGKEVTITPSLCRLDLQILTEFTWLAMTERSSIYYGMSRYYGWSSLLALLARADDTVQGPPHRSPPRPGSHRSTVTESIKTWYEQASSESWKQPATPRVSGRRKFFDSAANVLIAQAKLRERYRGQNSIPPIASAFSTSFDIELEMSLAKRNVGFVIVVPVYCLQKATTGPKSPRKASLHWLAAVVAPDPSGAIKFAQIVEPKEWYMLNGDSWSDYWPYANWPLVIHLVGCPVVKLPANDKPWIRAVGRNTSEPIDNQEMFDDIEGISPAVLMDEYDAIQQHSTEMFGSSGLPEQFASASKLSSQARFWMLMGVQMGDAAIRYGIASRLGPGKRGADSQHRHPGRAGLAVSSHVDPAARDLMQYYGIDLVQQNCDAFVEDLDHYAEHLQFEHADEWPITFVPRQECKLLLSKRIP